MFESCESLRIIDFSNLDLTKITNIESLDNAFLNCKKLEYINIKNLKSNINLESKFFNGIQKILTTLMLIIIYFFDNLVEHSSIRE